MTENRAFRLLLRLLPFDFRFDYGEQMEQVFHEQRHDVRTRSGAAKVWWQTVRDMIAIGPREHLSQLKQDVLYGLRGMRRRPGFVAAAVLTLAVGIGANTAMFSVLYAVLLQPLPYQASDQLVAVWNQWDGTARGAFSNPEYLDVSERSRTMDIAAAAASTVNVASDGGLLQHPERLQAAFVTTNIFRVLGAHPVLGRDFVHEEEIEGRDNVVILTDATWRTRFHAAHDVIGKWLIVDGRKSQIVGVMGPKSRMPLDFSAGPATEVIVPLTFARSAARDKRGGHFLRAYGRLNPGVSMSSAGAEMQTILAALKNEYPTQYDQGNFNTYLVPLRTDLLGNSRPILLVLTIAVGLVLLLACANVANLMLARGESRRGELAIRTALGASRFRIVRQLVTEAMMMSVAGAIAGLALAYVCLQLLRAWLLQASVMLPRIGEVSINLSVLLFTGLLCVLMAVLFGFAPALAVSQIALTETMNQAAGRSAGGRLRSNVRRVLVAAQVMLATVLLVASGLLLKSFVRVIDQPSGMNTHSVLTFRVSLPEAHYPGLKEVSSFYTTLTSKLSGLPGVEKVGASTGLPMAVASGDWSFDIEGRPMVNGKHPGRADWYVISPGYFESLGIALVKGRLPQWSDDAQAAPTIYLNETAAKTIFRGEDPIGKHLRLTNSTGPEQPWRTVAGIVADVRHQGLDAAPNAEMFIPHQQFLHFSAGAQARDMTIVLRTATAPSALITGVREILSQMDPELPAADVRDMDTVVSQSIADRKMLLALIGGFGWIAIVLSVIGIYGVMDYTVLQRRREMGVRLALGAPRNSVKSLIFSESMRVVIFGLVIGLIMAANFGGVLASLLFEVPPRDPTVYLMAGVLVILVSVGATLIPAWRAAHVDPTVALREA